MTVEQLYPEPTAADYERVSRQMDARRDEAHRQIRRKQLWLEIREGAVIFVIVWPIVVCLLWAGLRSAPWVAENILPAVAAWWGRL